MTTMVTEAEAVALRQGVADAAGQRHLLEMLVSAGLLERVKRAPVEVAGVTPVVRLQQLEAIAQLEQRRLIVQLVDVEGRSQVEVAALFGISQPTLHGRLQVARKVAPARPGFSGASPMELCQRYAAGLLSRAELVDQLTRWEYPPAVEWDPWDDLLMLPDGGFEEVGDALGRGLIDDELHDQVLLSFARD